MHGVDRIRVVLADDHPTLRTGVRAILEPELSMTLVGQATSFRDVMHLLSTIAADVVLLDLYGMGTPPITAVSSLARSYPQVAIIIFSSELTGAAELLKAGAAGYIAKEDLEEEIITAIHAVMRGQPFLSPTVIDYLDRSGGVQKRYGLAPREWDVLRLLAAGQGTREIASELMLSHQTVSNYISQVYRKTGCTERTQFVDWYRRVTGVGVLGRSNNSENI